MSDQYDYDEDPRPVVRQRIDCPSCEGRFNAEGYMESGGARDERIFSPSGSRCSPCLQLGKAPPPSPCCDVPLHGDEDAFACIGCDARFSVNSIRNYALGLDAARAAMRKDAK